MSFGVRRVDIEREAVLVSCFIGSVEGLSFFFEGQIGDTCAFGDISCSEQAVTPVSVPDFGPSRSDPHQSRGVWEGVGVSKGGW